MRATELFQRIEEIPEHDFVLHGSPHLLATLQPRKPTYDNQPHYRKFGLYVTNVIEIAIFYAVIRNANTRWSWKIEGTNESPEFNLYCNEKYQVGPGFIYVLKRKPFKKVHPSNEYVFRGQRQMQPIEVLQVDAVVIDELIEKGSVNAFTRERTSS